MKDPASADRRITDAFRAVAEEDARLRASPAVEANVMAAFDDIVRARHRRTRRIVSALGVAAVVVAVAAGAFKVRPLNSGERSPQTSDLSVETSKEVTTAFMPLAYSGVPIADGHVVRMEVPRASLVRFGLLPADTIEIGDATRGNTVIADVIIGDDGLARAVRFVRKLNRKEPRR
jgi:hypothetical protein